MSSRFFEKQRALSDRFRLIFWDLPGHGRSEKIKNYPLEDCARAMKEVLEQVGEPRVTAMGWSLGALVVWEYLRTYGAGPLVRLVNVESAPRSDPEQYQVPAVEYGFRHGRRQTQQKFIRKMFYGEPKENTLQWMLEEALQTPTEPALSLYRELSQCDYRQIAGHSPVPVISLMSRHGFHVDQVPEIKSLLKDSQVFWFQESGHMPFWEESEGFNQRVSKLLLSEKLD